MNPERLLALYENVADAPDAVPRLRRFVLDLAVRGKLVPQDASDEPASELLKRIAAEKARLVKAGEIRKSRKEADLSAEDPHELPDKWIWVPFGELHHLVRGVTYSKADVSETASAGFVPILRANNIGSTLTHDDPVYVKSDRVSPDQYLRRGDYMIALSSGSKNLVGKAAMVPDDLDEAFGGFCGAVRLFDPSLVGFVGVFLSSDLYRESISAGSRGIGINNLKKEVLANLHFPLPPLAEQRRIVAKVEELMALLDRLEAARGAAEAIRDRLTAASLARLTAPDTDPPDFPANARFALATLPTLTTRPDQIKSLRQTILNLAVRGKLVEQDPSDEPVSASLSAISAKRDDMVKKKELRREKLLNPVEEDDAPFQIPSTWQWVRVGELALFTQYGTSAKAAPSEAGIPVLTMGNIQDGAVVRTNEKRIPETSDELPSLYLKNLDLLYNRTNSAELVGKTGLYRGDDDCLTFASYLIRIRLSADHTSPIYVNLAMNAPDFRETQIVPHIKKQTGQANVSGSALKNMLIPLPPLAEQHRIVAKVDALMALCDRLEAALTTADTTRARLLEALLHEALTPTDAKEMEAAE
ncbi:restriction endonuclease subunit S [Mesobacterium sp. TK19101]|uniref:Restriction endonuclease subunit S n=1 Tax=Mesobacterium hydrothermale TaxID=3111907 RepID=A0ABU6HJZ9_9RHOB|nr:restriction endonuclease subunit S [Mesobacterium sp. TK19101]MEC3862759.1 restriction endonuclease subunit S [Mesobacterium sp. TK19101]